MAQTMRTVVFGTTDVPDHLVGGCAGVVRVRPEPHQKGPASAGPRRGRRERFYEALRLTWSESSPSGVPGLIASAKGTAHNRRLSQDGGPTADSSLDVYIHRVGHRPAGPNAWNGHGSRDEVYERVGTDVKEQGTASRAVGGRELGISGVLPVGDMSPLSSGDPHLLRLAPWGYVPGHPDTGRNGDSTLLHRKPTRALGGRKRPTTSAPNGGWSPEAMPAAVYPNLFLGGARNCPGKDLILFVCKAAIAALLENGQMRSPCPELSEDPVRSLSFPKSGLRFRTKD